MDTTQRKQFDNEFYNHQEEMEDMKTNVREILERYIDEINTLKSELANKK